MASGVEELLDMLYHNTYDKAVETRSRTLDDIQVSQGHRVKAARIEPGMGPIFGNLFLGRLWMM